jgi:deazaflavin-dependent oxidoreductase (nitroreductase family)
LSGRRGVILRPVADQESRRRRVVLLQKYLLNPPTKAAVFLGLVPGHAIIETTGRKTGKQRRTVVGVHEDGEHLWVVAEQGRHAGYVRNIDANPRVRVRLRGRWRDATAQVLDDDDPVKRVQSFGRERHARLVTTMGTSLLTLRFDLD